MKRLDQLLSMQKDNPNDSFLLFALAKEYEKLHHFNDALSMYLRLVQNDPGYTGTYYHLGKLYEILGKYPEALATYEKGMEISKTAGDQHAYNELAEARLGISDDE